MEIKTLLETPHRSVHWAILKRLLATTASTESPETLFATWRKLISQDVATRAPHVFSEAIDQIARLTLAGRMSIIQTVQAFTDLVAPPNIQKRSALDPSLLSVVCGALVTLLVAGGDALAFQDTEGARENIMRTALERDPSLFSPVLQHVYNGLVRVDPEAAIDSDIVFATAWANVGRFLKYAIVDPTVPPWAQNRTLSLLFDLVRELSIDRAAAVLDWLVDIGLAVVQPLDAQNASTNSTYMQIDVQGRLDRAQLIEQCTRAVELICANAGLTSNARSASSSEAYLDKLVSIVNRLRLMAASLLFSGTYGMDHIRQAHSRRSSHDGSALASVLDRLSSTSVALSTHTADGALGVLQVHSYSAIDMLVWALSAIQAVRAKSNLEQSKCLAIIDRILNTKSAFAGIPEQVIHIARFPLLCVAGSGFSQQTCSTAIRICKDIDQNALPMVSEFTKNMAPVRKAMADLATSAYVSGLLPLLLIDLDNYLSVYAAEADIAVVSMEAISKQPFFLAPFLFAWNSRALPNDEYVVLSQSVLADLLEALPEHPSLRLDLLPLFMYLLKRPETPSQFQQMLVRDGIPSLATTKDAFATSRVVSVISQIWNRSKDFSTTSSPTSSMPGSKDEGGGRLQLCCLAVRAWANIVVRNPRVWRDLRVVFVQFVESKKAAAIKALATCVLNPEYEWTVLMTIRDLVLYETEKYADEVLPLIYALFTYARSTLSVSSTAILVDILSACAEAHVADARNIWTAILSAQADFWLVKIDGVESVDTKSNMADQSAPVLNALARFFKVIATEGDGSGQNVTFRHDILLRYVAPICGLSSAKEVVDSPEDIPAPEEVGVVSADFFNALSPQTRNAFLSALAAFPTEDILPLVSGRSPTRLLNELLALATYAKPSSDIPPALTRRGCLADLLSVLMDNEVCFMRQSIFSGRNAVARSLDDNDRQAIDANASQGQKRIWAQSNFERSQWVNDALAPALRRASELYWSKDKHGGAVLAAGNALASMASVDDNSIGQKGNLARASITEKSDGVEIDTTVSNERQKMVAELRSLITDVRLSDHWCIHNLAVDTWQMWFTNRFRAMQSLASLESNAESGGTDSEVATGTDAGMSFIRGLGFEVLSALQVQLDPSGVPAHVANAIYAVSGLVKAAWSFDQMTGSELCVAASRLLSEHDILPIRLSADEFWLQKASTRNRDILIAAIECVSATAICQNHDIAALSRLAQFLMSGLTQYSVSGIGDLSSPVVYSLGRSLIHLHAALYGQTTDTRTFSEETVVVEADDIRRCIERLDLLRSGRPASAQNSDGSARVVDIGSIGLAISLATMHRRWISNIINPAMAEHNATPRAAQAQRTIAITLNQAFTNLSNVGNEQWSTQSLASLYYLCFVWPPRPISQRHVELHRDLFVVTPDRVWQTANRLVRRFWTISGQDDESAGSRNINLINHIEIAFSVLTYHLTMTTSQNTAQTAHQRLVKQYSGWIRGDAEGMAENLAANERSDMRVNSAVALAILLGVPMHGVAETTASNEYLPKTQQRNLPALLGIGSVQYGSTAWLRVSEPLLHESLRSLLACSGLAQHQDTDDIDLGCGQLEVDDARVAHVSSLVLGGLFAQSLRAMQLLSLTDEVSTTTHSTSGSVKGDKHASRLVRPDSVQRPDLDSSDGLPGAADQAATAMDEEPKSLGHLPAPTSWCRAVWESVGELSGSMVDSDGVISGLVESKLGVLLLSILRMERPFPVVDMRTSFANVLGIYMRMLATSDGKRLPIVALLLKVASKLGCISYSASQFLMDCCCELASKAVGILSAETRLSSASRTDGIDPDSLVNVALCCLGSTGLGRVLELAGFSFSKQDSQVDGLDPVIRRLVSTNNLWAEEKLDLAMHGQLSCSLRKNESIGKKGAVESDAERMFRLLSKVGIQESQAANTCAKLLSQVFSGDGTSVALIALRIRLLSTLETRSTTVTRKSAREMITVAVARLLDGGLIAKATDNSAEGEALLWSAVGVVYCGADLDKGSELLAKDAPKLSDAEYLRLAEYQSIVLRRRISGDPGVDRDTAGSSSAVSAWLRLVFREWGRRINVESPRDTQIEKCLQNVALAMFNKRQSVGGGQGSVVDACRLITQGLDMAILAVSSYDLARERNKSKDDSCISYAASTIIASTLANWILPLLTGRCASLPSGTDNDIAMLLPSIVLACREVMEYVDLSSRALHTGPNLGSDAETSSQQQFHMQLRTRIQRLLELAPHYAIKRTFNGILSDLAMLGMLPPSDLSSIL
ncbi:hypothetical protein LPJ59_000451 [Coemansia sp. RSA 2399]|nr:hypothetical protein LPJ59_000451 [Coemansia sp. RSA 2399]KAJ1907669.1 hypothetical protein LPJ81_000606 [Coemansia sp. IMI 209127]